MHVRVDRRQPQLSPLPSTLFELGFFVVVVHHSVYQTSFWATRDSSASAFHLTEDTEILETQTAMYGIAWAIKKWTEALAIFQFYLFLDFSFIYMDVWWLHVS